MADLAASDSDAPASSRTPRRERRRAFENSSFHWCLAILGIAAAFTILPLWAPLLLASWMAVAFRPLHAKLARHDSAKSGAAAVLTVLLVAVALLPLVIIGLSLLGSAVTLAEQLQKSGGMRDALENVLSYQPGTPRGRVNIQSITEFVQRHGGGAWRAASTFFGAASAAIIGMFIFVYGFFVCLVDGKRAHEWILDHSPLQRWQTERLVQAYQETGRGLLIGVGLTALLQGTVATLGYLIIGVPQALMFGLLTAISALIPSIGTGLVWVPLCIGLFAAGRTGAGIAVLALGCVISIADNFARPLLSRRGRLELPTFVLLVAMLGGIVAFGPWGLLAGPLFVRMVIEALRIGRERQELGGSAEPRGPGDYQAVT